MHALPCGAIVGLVLLGAHARAGERELTREPVRAEAERDVAEDAERVHTGPMFRLALGSGYFSAHYEGELAACALCAERKPSSSRITAPAFAAEALLGWGYQGWMFGARLRVLVPFEWSMVVPADYDPIDPNPFAVVMPGLFVDWYPDPRAGFHVTLAPSFGTSSVSDVERRLSRSGVLFGPAVGIGIGYQFWLPAAASVGVLAGTDLGWLSYEDPAGIEQNKMLALTSATLAIEVTFNGEKDTHERR